MQSLKHDFYKLMWMTGGIFQLNQFVGQELLQPHKQHALIFYLLTADIRLSFESEKGLIKPKRYCSRKLSCRDARVRYFTLECPVCVTVHVLGAGKPSTEPLHEQLQTWHTMTLFFYFNSLFLPNMSWRNMLANARGQRIKMAYVRV